MASKQNKNQNQGKDDSFKSFREGIESVVIAIVLAFLFRAFEAEAFVIPTGSMAPTLQGRHKDVECEACHFQYQTGDSFDSGSTIGSRIERTICPMCSYPTEMKDGVGFNQPISAAHISHTGDRILVNKFAYESPFGDPQRWDVIVFKYPNNAKQNYIKRLVGLPGEEVTIRHGDIFITSPESQGDIARKPQQKLRYMLQLVNDSKYIPAEWEKFGWPSNWNAASKAGSWKTDDNGRSFACSPSDQTEWINFQQYNITANTWDGWDRSKATEAKPILITDYYTYNTKTNAYDPKLTHGLHWVGDLAVEAEVEVKNETGTLTLELIEAGRRHQCQIDISTGIATLSIDNGSVNFDAQTSRSTPKITSQTKLKGKGDYKVRFANVDNQLTLWVNNRVCDFGQPATYAVNPDDELPTNEDLTPVRLGAANTELIVKNLRVLRDVYYLAIRYKKFYEHDYDANYRGNLDVMTNPEHHRDLFKSRRTVSFKLEEDQFFPLGDNSPMSKDARLWEPPHFVHRDMLIGKAVLVYWPHPIHVKIPFMQNTIPAFPNFKRMKLIR